MRALKQRIEVWYDETSDPEKPLWCVSLCDADGEEQRCLERHKKKVDAVQQGAAIANTRELPLLTHDN